MTTIQWVEEDEIAPQKPVTRAGPLIPWGGGECPVHPEARVRCHFRGRRPYVGPAINPNVPQDKQASIWRHAPFYGRTDPAFDIVAYEVLTHG